MAGLRGFGAYRQRTGLPAPGTNLAMPDNLGNRLIRDYYKAARAARRMSGKREPIFGIKKPVDIKINVNRIKC
jgi:hypothetical protein